MQSPTLCGHGGYGVHAKWRRHSGLSPGWAVFDRLPPSEDNRCKIYDRDIYMTSQNSCINGSGLTKTEWELLLEAIHAYNHNTDYRTLHSKLTVLARASGVRPKGGTMTGEETSRAGQSRRGLTG